MSRNHQSVNLTQTEARDLFGGGLNLPAMNAFDAEPSSTRKSANTRSGSLSQSLFGGISGTLGGGQSKNKRTSSSKSKSILHLFDAFILFRPSSLSRTNPSGYEVGARTC
jgi:hypothetical protein